MKRQSKVLITTKYTLKEKLEVIEMEQDIHPPIEREKMNHIFTSIAKVDNKGGTIYVNNNVNFPIRVIEGYTAILNLYDCKMDSVLAAPIKYTKDEIIEAFQTYIKYITKRAFKTRLNSIDNVALKSIKV